MAEIVQIYRPCADAAPVSLVGWLLRHLRPRARRLGNADELPDRMRRDMGLAPIGAEPGRHYHDYLTHHGF